MTVGDDTKKFEELSEKFKGAFKEEMEKYQPERDKLLRERDVIETALRAMEYDAILVAWRKAAHL